MPELPAVTGAEAIRALAKIGFKVVRIRGSHHNLKRDGHRLVITVPVHGQAGLKRGTLRSIIRSADLTVEQFLDLL